MQCDAASAWVGTGCGSAHIASTVKKRVGGTPFANTDNDALRKSTGDSERLRLIGGGTEGDIGGEAASSLN